MVTPVDDKSLLGDLVPNIYIKRIVLDYNARTTKFRGSNPHYILPPPSNVGQSGPGQSFIPPATANRYAGLYGSQRPNSIPFSSYNSEEQASKPDSTNVKVDLVIKDTIDHKFISNFFTNENIKSFIKIKIIKSTDSSFTFNLMNAPKNGHYYTLLMQGGNVFGDNVKTLSLKDFPGQDENYITFESDTNDEGKKVYDVTTSVDFSVEQKDIEHLSIMTFAYIDKQAFSESINPNLNLDNIPNLGDLLIGKINYEPIIINGDLVTEAVHYEDSAGKIWLGDVFVDFDDPNFSASDRDWET